MYDLAEEIYTMYQRTGRLMDLEDIKNREFIRKFKIK